jgi:hypothetical protein
MVGKLEVLNLKIIERRQHDCMEIAGQLAGAILPLVHFLAPDSPFEQLFDHFEDDDDRVAAVAAYVAKAKGRMKQR